MARKPTSFTGLLRAWPKAVIALTAIAVFFLVLKVSIVGALRGPYPGAALDWSPHDATARANLASLIVTRDRSPAALDQAVALAQDSLRRDPTQVGAVRTLAIVSMERNDEAGALRRMALAERLSRRDHLTQSWYIRHYSQKAQPDALIRHFDIALRTSNRNRQTLLPLLVGATIDAGIVGPLRSILQESPSWRREFAAIAVDRVPSPHNTVAILRGMLDPQVPEERLLYQTLIYSLISRREYDLAADVYAEIPGSGSHVDSAVRNGGFELGRGFPPFDWELTQEADLWAVREQLPGARGGSVLRVVAFNGRTGEPVRQLLRLPAGSYRLRATVGDVPADPFDRPTVRLVCAVGADANAYISLRPSRAGEAPTQIQGGFVIPPSCRWQWLLVRVAGNGSRPENSPWIDDISIDRAS